MPSHKGTIRLFQLFGITVFLHWSWFLVAVYEIQRQQTYSSVAWNALEYLAVFAIVTLHEFGHALACRSVGGRAEQIVLWPLGGVAYVNPPVRPGATLWSIAAGPLVNVALVPFLAVLAVFTYMPGTDVPPTDFGVFVRELNVINLVLFLFNVLPFYPLDGGKIVRSLLWYVVGRARSLMATAIVGFIGVAGMGLLALMTKSAWVGLLTVFAATQCINGFKQAQILKRLEALPRRSEAACPSCKSKPPIGAFWVCSSCRAGFDTFETGASCPQCGMTFATTMCLDCLEQNPISTWRSSTERTLAAETVSTR
jgi:Zn-dependent protease